MYGFNGTWQLQERHLNNLIRKGFAQYVQAFKWCSHALKPTAFFSFIFLLFYVLWCYYVVKCFVIVSAVCSRVLCWSVFNRRYASEWYNLVRISTMYNRCRLWQARGARTPNILAVGLIQLQAPNNITQINTYWSISLTFAS